MSEFLSMGGYGVYVWPSFAISLAALTGLAIAIWRRGRALRRKLAALESARAKTRA